MKKPPSVKTKQRTFYVEGEKIHIKARQRENILNGYDIRINGERFFDSGFDKNDKDSMLGISIQTAMDRCYVRWVNRSQERDE